MTNYTVTTTIQSRDLSNPPVDVRWYAGDNLGQALAALVQAAAHDESMLADSILPNSMRYDTPSVRFFRSDVTEPDTDEGLVCEDCKGKDGAHYGDCDETGW